MQLSKVKAAAVAFPALIGSALVSLPAHAQFASPAAQDFAALIGDSTSGSETGVYELQPLILGAGLAIVTLTVIMVGIVFARKVVRKFTG
jgi:hypothetical protein